MRKPNKALLKQNILSIMAYFTLESMLLVDNNIIRQKKQNQMINSIAP